MASLDGEVFDVDPARLRDPQSKQPEQAGESMATMPTRDLCRLGLFW
jgi:hypothetical protein